MAHMLGSANSQRCLVRWHDVSKTRVAPRAIAPSAGVAPKHTCLKRDIQSSKVAQRHVLCHASPDTCPDLSAYLKLKRQQGDGTSKSGPGKVYLVGTGPGDPGLLTVRALQLLQSADVVLYDRLVSDDILGLIHGSATMVYVGKEAGFHTRTQEEIHQMLLAFAEAGASVVRLKGGDPYVFGRGGEELAYLRERGIKVHAVPGITAAAGICAELGIPMTHRGVATSVRFLTGHSREGGKELLDQTIAACADPYTTLVVYMGLQTLPELSKQLLENGLTGSTPAVAVERGTTADERVVYGTLEELHGLTKAAQLQSPTLIVIGDVVALSEGWQDWQQSGRPLVYAAGQQWAQGLQQSAGAGAGAAEGAAEGVAAA